MHTALEADRSVCRALGFSRDEVLYSESELDISSNYMVHMVGPHSVAEERQCVSWSCTLGL